MSETGKSEMFKAGDKVLLKADPTATPGRVLGAGNGSAFVEWADGTRAALPYGWLVAAK